MFELPVFDPTRKPIIKDNKMSSGLVTLIQNCLRLNPAERPHWADIDFAKIKREKKDEVILQDIEPEKPEKEEIRLGSRKEAQRANSPEKSEKPKNQQIDIFLDSQKRAESPKKVSESLRKPSESYLNESLSKDISEARLK